jgi:hypothetical protein
LYGLPPLICLVPDNPASPRTAWRVFFGDSIHLEEDLKSRIAEKFIDPFDPFAIRDEESEQTNGNGGEIGLTCLLTSTQEHALEVMYNELVNHPGYQKILFTKVMRQAWEFISGQVLDHRVSSNWQVAEQLTKFRSRMIAEIPSVFEIYLKEIPAGRPHIMSTHSELSVLLQLGQQAMEAFRSGSKRTISHEDIEKEDCFENPFARIISWVFGQAEKALLPPPRQKREDLELDRSFILQLKSCRSMKGSGDYRNFSVEIAPLKDGALFGRICMSLGDTPLLQQVSVKPIFLFWDLKTHPTTVFFEQSLEIPGRTPYWQLGHAKLLVHSNHQSITRHAFVQPIADDETTGSICTEQTFDRTISLHNSSEHFDPVLCLLDQLRAAGRILKYGVRSRDKAINQHNLYGKVPDGEYQAVIKGWPEAKAFAEKHKAEIVPYVR